MLLSKKQTSRFWRDWSAACKAQGWTTRNGWNTAQIQEQRYALLSRAGFNSLTEVDPTRGFDRLLAELGLLQDNLARTAETLPAAQVEVPAGLGLSTMNDDPGERRRILFRIREHTKALGGDRYSLKIARDKFKITPGLSTIEDLTLKQLHSLLITLSARHHKKDQTPGVHNLRFRGPVHSETPRLDLAPVESSSDPF